MNAMLLRRLKEISLERYQSVSGTEPRKLHIQMRHMAELSTGQTGAPSVYASVHGRFDAFPPHTHDYIEMMYVCGGSIRHVLGSETVVLREGDILLLGRAARHAIEPTEEQDVGVNLIIPTDFFASLLPRLREGLLLPESLLDDLLGEGEDTYTVYHTKGILPIENLMESISYSIVSGHMNEPFVLRESLGLLFCYLSAVPDAQYHRSDAYAQTIQKQLMSYIRTSYRTATLSEAAAQLGFSSPYLCRWIRSHMGTTFKTLLSDHRFTVAGELLRGTSCTVEQVIEQVGYENRSYFHQQFCRRYGMTPHAYRQQGRR